MNLVALGVCLQLAMAPEVAPVFITTESFTLAWTHTIEKVRWEEDYRVLSDQQPAVLYAVSARIKGSAAGMEPPPDAVLHNGWYHYEPQQVNPQVLLLTRSEFSPDYEWCDVSGCVPLSAKIPRDGGVTILQACSRELTEIE